MGGATLAVVALASLALAGGAAAKLVPPYTVFQQCPYKNTEVKKCVHAVTEGGVVILGNKKVPIVNPVTINAGLGKQVETFAPFFAATDGITLSKTPQPVPGGLAGLVNCKEIKNTLLRWACEAALENEFTGANSTLELARPVGEAKLSELHLAEEIGVAMKLPVKIHLENPFLGSNCYIGSESSPIIWELTTGKTSPPGPNTSITGTAGVFNFLDEGRVVEAKGAELVDNAWAAPGANGCGGFLVELLLDPVIEAAVGVPAAKGHNTAILKNTATLSTTAAIRTNDEENP